jgi:hypothetical protein
MPNPGQPLLVYLADLTHTGVHVATESFPLNIGLVAAFAKRHLGEAVEFRLFKYPDKLFAAVKDRPPDVLGCSNYVWNSNLTAWACEFTKARSPEVLTVLGGTNYPFDADGQREFLRLRRYADVHVFYEGEVAFLQLLQSYLAAGDVASSARPRPRLDPLAVCDRTAGRVLRRPVDADDRNGPRLPVQLQLLQCR